MDNTVEVPTASDLGVVPLRAASDDFRDCATDLLPSIRDNFTDPMVRRLFNEVIRLRTDLEAQAKVHDERVTDLLNANNSLIERGRLLEQKFDMVKHLAQHLTLV